MKKLLTIIIFLFFGALAFCQEQEQMLADDYFRRGEFEKAAISYERLHKKSPGNYIYIYNLVEAYQQLNQYDKVEEVLSSRILQRRDPTLLIELGYNFQLKDSLEMAQSLYDEALRAIDERPTYASMIASRFQNHSLLDEAATAYKKGMELNPNVNFNIQLAQIYGEQGDVESMFSNYIDYIEQKPPFINNAKRAFSDFVSENKDNENNLILKKLLLKKIQSNPIEYWYDLLSWLFVQEKDYEKSFVQEKALYKRNPESLTRIIELALSAVDEKQIENANDIFNFVLENTQDIETLLVAHQYLLEIETENASKKDYDDINKKYLALFNQYGSYEQTLALQIAYGNFLAFYLNQPEQASDYLKKSLQLNLSPFQEATVKLKLGDILVLQEKFNEALIYYSQIQANLKNSTISQEARFKVAKTSYYKGDFDWAETQLKILKSSTSQLIANDALDLKLLISDNKYDDSLHVALKLYSKADLLAFQNKTDEAIVLLNTILTEHKGESIEDEALYKQAQLFEKKKQFDKAIENYQAIIANYSEEIFADDALYYLAELYNNELAEPEMAKPLYERIIFEHEDSIYFVEARKKFRMLRGDAIN